jgi:outer membrane protein assembly factor BamC
MLQFTLRATLLAAALFASGCSLLQEDKVEYRSVRQGNSLAVPPDLTQLSRDNRFAVPGTVVTASGFQNNANTPGAPVAANTVGDVRIERSGNQRWLVVARPPEQIWPVVKDFWLENGFLLAQEQQSTGILETDWAENRAKLPQDFIRNTLGRVFDSLYDTGERDKFRTRLERSSASASNTEVYISHRGMVEKVITGGSGTVWEPRAPSPELEAEFLQRLMVRLGSAPEQAKAQVAAAPAAKPQARVGNAGGRPVVELDEGFDRAWRRVGLSLDRSGFTVEDRDRQQGLYFVRYVDPTKEKQEPGFLGRIFGGGSREATPLKYRVAIKSQGEASTVSVLNAEGQPDTSANAQRIVQVLAEDLK